MRAFVKNSFQEVTLDNIFHLNISNLYSYGVQIYGGNNVSDRCFIRRDDWAKGNYRVICVAALTRGNSYINSSKENLVECILFMLKIGDGSRVFRFETSRDLMAWLAGRVNYQK